MPRRHIIVAHIGHSDRFFVNCKASMFSPTGDTHKWVMWVCMDGRDDTAWLKALDEDAGLNAQIIDLQENCAFRVNNEWRKFQCKLTRDGKLIMVTNGGRKCWWGCHDASGLVPIEDTVNKIQWGVFVRSVCIRIGDYAHAGCR